MKLMDVAEFYSPLGGGVRTYIEQKIAAGKRLGWETVIVAPGPEDREEERDGAKIIWVKAPRIPFDHRYHQFVSYKGIHRAINQERPDVLEASSPWVGGWAVAKWPGDCLKSFFMHNDPVGAYPHAVFGNWVGIERIDKIFTPFWKYLGRLRAGFDTMVVSTDWMANRVHGFDIPRPTVIGFGVDRALFSPSLRDPDAKREMLAACGVDNPEARLMIGISRHHPEKKIGTILSAFQIASQKQEMGFFLIGDGFLRKKVEKHAARIPGVRVAGVISDRAVLARYLASADVFLHGAGFETFGLVVAEALCSGVPLIVPKTGGAGEMAAWPYAETYDVGDAVGGAQAIENILSRDLSDLRAEATAAGERLRKPEKHFQELFDYYGQIAKARPISKPRPVLDIEPVGVPLASDAIPAQIQSLRN